MNGKPPSLSAIQGLKIPYEIIRGHFNPMGSIFGGYPVYVMDGIAGTVACSHSEKLCVTRGVGEVEYLEPIWDDDDLFVWACVNNVWNKSMEVGVRTCSRRRGERKLRHVVSAYFFYVAVEADRAARKLRTVPIGVPLFPQTARERKRFAEADLRRARRFEQELKK